MSKELTEQWRNGTLPENWYYIQLKSNWGNIDCITINYCDEDGVFEEYPDEDIKEVLAPVPTYDEYAKNGTWYTEKSHNKLVTKCNRLEKMINEANEVIKYYANSFCGDKQKDGTYLICTRENDCGRVEITYNPNIAKSYLEKCGVK